MPPLTRRQLLNLIARDAVSGLGWGVVLGIVGWVILGLSYGFAATFRPIDLAHPTGLVGCTGAPAFLSFLAIWHNLTGETSISIGTSFFLAACLFVFIVMLAGFVLAAWIGTGGSFLVVTIACFTVVGGVAGLARARRAPEK